jgi:rod shape determining protein RodA
MKREIWQHFDYWLFGAVVILSIFGIAMIRSAIAGNEELAGYVTRQTMWVVLGLVVVVIMTIVDYHYWAAFSRVMYIFIIGFLMVIYVAGAVSFGAKRWLETGLVNIQPAELAKIIMIMVLADYFSRHKDDPHNLNWILRSFLLTAFVVVWILLQPNLSTSIVIFVNWFAMLWLSGLDPRFLFAAPVLGAVGGVGLFPFLEPYQQQRVMSFIFPDPTARHGNTYNVEQALVTIGSGGWFGQGYGHGSQVQLRFLKVRHTDFIFSAMSQEFGFVGTVIVIALLLFVVYRIFRIAQKAPDLYGALIAYGFGVLMFFQMIVNIGVNLNVIPVTGLTLPFISYGGSSVASLLLGIGLVESVAARHKTLDF